MSLVENVAAPALSARLDAVIDRALAERRIVGTVVAVAHDGDCIYRRAAGLADREAGTAMREDAIFLLSSVTKPMVTAAAMALWEDGLVDLDMPVDRLLPDFRPKLADGSQPAITIHQLLTHTAGLSYGFFEPPQSAYHLAGVSDGLDQPGLSLGENLRRLALVPLLYPPGKSWRYSIALDVLGAALEAVAQRGLGEILRQRVTGPLGLDDTGFTVADTERLVRHYADGSDQPVAITEGMAVQLFDGPVRFAPGRILDPYSYASGGGGMAGTAGDVLKFLEAIRRGGAPILRDETVALMMRDHVGIGAWTRGPGWGFGYGWSVLGDAGLAKTPQRAGTLQWGGVYGHSWFIDPASGLSVVILTNTAFEGMSGAFTTAIRDALYADR